VQGVVNDRLNAIGTGDAIRSVAVTPQATGTIREILIKSGDMVKQGQVLAKLDSEEQVIAQGQAQVALNSALEKSSLYHNIKSSVSRMDVFDSEIAEQNARLQLQAADLNLQRRNIVAPIDGIVGIVPVNIGDIGRSHRNPRRLLGAGAFCQYGFRWPGGRGNVRGAAGQNLFGRA